MIHCLFVFVISYSPPKPTTMNTLYKNGPPNPLYRTPRLKDLFVVIGDVHFMALGICAFLRLEFIVFYCPVSTVVLYYVC